MYGEIGDPSPQHPSHVLLNWVPLRHPPRFRHCRLIVIVCTTVANRGASTKRKARDILSTAPVAVMHTDKYSHSALGPLGSRRADCLRHPSPSVFPFFGLQLDALICIVFYNEIAHKQLENHDLAVVLKGPKHVCGSE